MSSNRLLHNSRRRMLAFRGQTGLTLMHPISQKAMTSQIRAAGYVFVFLGGINAFSGAQSLPPSFRAESPEREISLNSPGAAQSQAGPSSQAQSATSSSTQTSAPASQSRDQASQKDK